MSVETTTDFEPPSAEERELTQTQIELANRQLSALDTQEAFQTALFPILAGDAGLIPELDDDGNIISFERDPEFVARQEATQERIDTQAAAQDELLQLELERIRSGGAATPEQIELIKQATDAALEAGTSDISQFQREATELLREELAPSLGLRPGDTPILDRGARIATEATRQAGQLSRNLRGAEATARLNLPLAISQISQSQQGINLAAQEFQTRLRESAFRNRQALLTGTTSAGLGLASVAAPNIAGTLSALAATRGGTSTTGGLGASIGLGIQAVGAAGGLLSGIGSLTAPKKAA